MSTWPKSIGFDRAIDMLRAPDHRMMKMTTNQSPEGFAFFIVPGGYISPEVAQKIMAHPQIRACEDGLFPGHSQTWKIIT